MLMTVLMLFVMLGACREKAATGEAAQTATTGTEATEAGASEVSETTEETSTSETTESTTPADVNANEDVFVQTGTQDEDITLGVTESDPSTIVVNYGDLVTLNLYSERLKPTEVYNEDLLVDETVNRAGRATITIQANENGYFNIIDKNTGETLFRFIVAEETLKGKAD